MSESTLIWLLAGVLAGVVVVPYAWAFHRRHRHDRERLAEARGLGIDRPTAQYPYVDATRCIGCGSCVRACPEGDVLGVVGGTAVVVNGLRCVGHARCEEECPVGAIEVGLGDVKGRADLPVLDRDQESTVPGVFIAGELSGMALIRNAIEQGEKVVAAIAARRTTHSSPAPPTPPNSPLAAPPPAAVDVLIVGAGPAGLAAALAAKARGLSHLVLEQEQGLGGTVLHFPRRKLVLTRPVDLPLGGRLDRSEYSKEELLARFEQELATHRLDLRFGARMTGLVPLGDGLVVETSAGTFGGRNVVLTLGRRGTPRRLGVPGEELPKVTYQLRDAESYRSQHLLVVGGGDSAVEAAIGLAGQPGNRVTIAYRKSAFFRIKQKNHQSVARLIARGKVEARFDTEVVAITPAEVTLSASGQLTTLANDAVFVLIGGDPPFALLRRIGIRFGGDPEPARPGFPRTVEVPS